LLAAVYDRFVEGAGTVDYELAGKLLKELVHLPASGEQNSRRLPVTSSKRAANRALGIN
jgi:hypothetical protein